MRRWVNFQFRGVLLIWIRRGWGACGGGSQGLSALAVGVIGDGLEFLSLIYHFFFLSPSLWQTARYRLKYWLKGPFSTRQPTNQPVCIYISITIIFYLVNGFTEKTLTISFDISYISFFIIFIPFFLFFFLLKTMP